MTQTRQQSLVATCIIGAVMVAVWLASSASFAPPAFAYVSGGLLIALLALSWFDFDHFRIPLWINLPLVISGLALAYARPDAAFLLHGLGAVIGFGLVWALNLIWQRWRGQDGIGMGDAILLGAAGAWVSVFGLPFVTLVASGSALVFIFARSALTGAAVSGGERVPFGPFIALGLWTVWLIGGALGI